jgi:Uma2 family endonuclease
MLRLINRNVRIPDFSFFRWERLPDRKRPKGQIPEITPDLAVEILSPSNMRREMEIKRHEYFKSGAQIVWEVEPESKIVRVYPGPKRS